MILWWFKGLAVGSGDGDPLQGNSPWVNWRRATWKDGWMRPARSLRQSLSHQCLRPRTRSLPRQLYYESRWVYQPIQVWADIFSREFKYVKDYYYERPVKSEQMSEGEYSRKFSRPHHRMPTTPCSRLLIHSFIQRVITHDYKDGRQERLREKERENFVSTFTNATSLSCQFSFPWPRKSLLFFHIVN